jgi:exodeoxyribonuclease VII large subunit
MAATGSKSGKPRLWTVSEVTASVRDTLERAFSSMWLTGEVSNLTTHRSGHVYLTLKDAASQISAVFFSGAGTVRSLKIVEGMEVEIYGRLSVYEPRGTYQFTIREMRPKGLGALQMRFEELKRKLESDGLFEAARKRPLPMLPQCVGVVTSPDGAALRDFLNIIHRRFADMHVRIFPAAVQGENAVAEIVRGIEFFNCSRSCDVIVVTRGGGSLEDLWAFNEERVARAIAASTLPVVSAVGHEVDFTIADFVADLRVPTPSAAAELVVGRKAELLERLAAAERTLANNLNLRLSRLRNRVQRAAQSYVFREPMNLVRRHQQRVDELGLRLQQRLRTQVVNARHCVERMALQLQALNPRRVLSRGYAILINENGKAVRAPDDVTAGTVITGIVAEGEIKLTVDNPNP